MDAAERQVRRLIEALSKTEAYRAVPGEGPVEVVQTHASVVFLRDQDVYKVKKPVDFGFLDYRSLEARAHFCREEVRLNRRLAPDVYLGVVPVTESSAGALMLGGDGEVVDHAVHMRRLPAAATLRAALRRGELEPKALGPVGLRLARFHADAERSAAAARYAQPGVVAANARDNVEALRETDWLDAALVQQLSVETEAELAGVASVLEGRAAAGVACELHGDLRLEHVYRFGDAAPPGDLVFLDGIEFNDAFRLGDPVSDLAFLAMDLQAYGAWPHAEVLVSAWLAASADDGAEALLPLYLSYRSAVRAKVAVLAASEPELGEDARDQARARAVRHLRQAVGALLAPEVRPRLIAVGGLPGVGKTTLARGIAAHLPADVIRTDVVRKELAGLDPETPAAAPVDSGIYTRDMTDFTYRVCLDRARAAIERGRVAILDGSFWEQSRRDEARRLAQSLGVPFHMVVCELSRGEALARIAARRGDASDADARVHDAARARWEHVRGWDAQVVDTGAPDVEALVSSLLSGVV